MLAEQLILRAATERPAVPHATRSGQLHEAERALGVRLLNRAAPRVSFTFTGARLLKRTRRTAHRSHGERPATPSHKAARDVRGRRMAFHPQVALRQRREATQSEVTT
jgi:DNA-binding transcriptional LysR family regulator